MLEELKHYEEVNSMNVDDEPSEGLCNSGFRSMARGTSVSEDLGGNRGGHGTQSRYVNLESQCRMISSSRSW